MSPPVVRVGLIQSRPLASISENLNKATQLIEEAKDQGAQIICLPELFLTPYFCQTQDTAFFEYAEYIPGPTTSYFEELSAKLEVVILASFFEKRAVGLYHNTVVVLDPFHGFLGKYRKHHIPDDPQYYEKFYFTPGDTGYQVFKTSYGTIGILICWDQWFPEAARLTAMQGASILFYPTAIGWMPKEKEEFGATQLDAWCTIQRSHGIANGCYIASINRTGWESQQPASTEGIEFWGSSFLSAPNGKLLCQASSDQEEILVYSISLKDLADFRNTWPFFRDRRIDTYSPITQRYLDE